MTSSISSLEELASGLPTGFILMPTTSPGSKKLRQASTASSAPVSSFMPRSTAALIACAVLDVVLDHPRIADLDDPAGIGAGDAPLRALGRPCRRPPWAPGPRHKQGIIARDRGDRGTQRPGSWRRPIRRPAVIAVRHEKGPSRLTMSLKTSKGPRA